MLGEAEKLLPIGAGLSDTLDVLIAPEAPDGAAGCLLGTVLAGAGAVRTCDLIDLPPQSRLRGCAAPPGWQATLHVSEPCPVLILPEVGQDFRCTVPSGAHRKLRMNRHRAERAGGWTMELATRHTLSALFETVLNLHAARWTTRGQPGGVLADPRVGATLRQAIPALHHDGAARVAVLRIDGAVAAGCVALLAGPDRLLLYLGRVRCRVHALQSRLAAAGRPGRTRGRRRQARTAFPARVGKLQIRLGSDRPAQRHAPAGAGVSDAVDDFCAGRVSAEAALARLALSGLSLAQIAERVGQSPLAAALDRHRDRLGDLAAMLRTAAVDHAGARDPQAIGRMFDRAVQAAPEASVAAYTLGDPVLLSRATAEIVAWLRAGLLRPQAEMLDLGCGIGRVAAALAPHCAYVLGLDVSTAMIAEARRRHGRLSNIRFEVTDGGPVDAAANSLDLVLAVDSFPYLVQAGMADAHAEAAARALRPGGVLAILNLSYTNDLHDLACARNWASRFGLSLEMAGTRPFSSWDGAAYVLRRSDVLRSSEQYR